LDIHSLIPALLSTTAYQQFYTEQLRQLRHSLFSDLANTEWVTEVEGTASSTLTQRDLIC
jgi:type VI protein secretion system component VasK